MSRQRLVACGSLNACLCGRSLCKAEITEAGLERIIFFNRSGTQCFIASNSRFAIVVFRGSETWNRDNRFDPRQMISDFFTDIDIRLSDWIRGGKVHTGFMTALESIWDDMQPEIKRLQDQGVLIWLTGHSLGAALATWRPIVCRMFKDYTPLARPEWEIKNFNKDLDRKLFE